MAAMLGIPLLVVCLVVGLVVSIFETATQIHEQSLNFLPKLVAVLIVLLVAGGWMVSQLSSFTREVFQAIAGKV
ncbi:flagellar type III secretion system protein FliQ [Ethanoligenens harbinense]|nr:EscS/YscS/HrcS family type III secretion system export apparatus protein [Ethanoligenens harbinense YUAN-3]AYF40164.1 EscS/YscS/HrcS family type III secretion system export apparatus protein [Ethanoligenens harbinense]AYF43005.1 EscS/YscS/HrcS family type III secretion system export apparatus protein [Ethanoligenens harbinense]QCN93767.1 flagellar type III secretion system protein FliQ [Ethanoligenens harbinense]